MCNVLHIVVFPFVLFSVGHCVVCHTSIYGFWLPLCYLQTLLIKLKYKIQFINQIKNTIEELCVNTNCLTEIHVRRVWIYKREDQKLGKIDINWSTKYNTKILTLNSMNLTKTGMNTKRGVGEGELGCLGRESRKWSTSSTRRVALCNKKYVKNHKRWKVLVANVILLNLFHISASC